MLRSHDDEPAHACCHDDVPRSADMRDAFAMATPMAPPRAAATIDADAARHAIYDIIYAITRQRFADDERRLRC